MTIFDLIFLAALLASAIALSLAASAALRGRGAGAVRVLSVYGVCVALYVASSLAVAYLRARSASARHSSRGASTTGACKFSDGDVHALGLITGHPAPYCGWLTVLFIGEATCLFDRPEMIRIE